MERKSVYKCRETVVGYVFLCTCLSSSLCSIASEGRENRRHFWDRLAGCAYRRVIYKLPRIKTYPREQKNRGDGSLRTLGAIFEAPPFHRRSTSRLMEGNALGGDFRRSRTLILGIKESSVSLEVSFVTHIGQPRFFFPFPLKSVRATR